MAASKRKKYMGKDSGGETTKLSARCFISLTRGMGHIHNTQASAPWERGVPPASEGRSVASGCERGEEDGFFLLPSLGPGRTHRQALPLPPLSQESHLGDMFSSNHHSECRRDWPGPNHYGGRYKW